MRKPWLALSTRPTVELIAGNATILSAVACESVTPCCPRKTSSGASLKAMSDDNRAWAGKSSTIVVAGSPMSRVEAITFSDALSPVPAGAAENN